MSLENDLYNVYSVNDASSNAPQNKANDIGTAIKNYATSQTVSTKITTTAGSVASFFTSGPVSGSGSGGVDSLSAGLGLAGAVNKLQTDLANAWANTATPTSAASGQATAIDTFFKNANIMTQDVTAASMSAPAPTGPVAGSITGKGGIDKNTPGMGYSAALGTLQSAIQNIFQDLSTADTYTRAGTLANAIYAFLKEGIVSTTGTFTAVAAVSASGGAGSYVAGTGTGSGTIS